MLPAPVQHRSVRRRVWHRRPVQHWRSSEQARVSPGPKHAVVALTQRPVLQVSPGQQSLPDAQVSLATRQRQ